MKKLIITIFITTLLLINLFGYSLRMDTMGRINITLEDFESDLQVNPALVTNMDRPYLKLTFGRISSGYTDNSEREDLGDSYKNSSYTDELSQLPLKLTGFYKFGNISLGIQLETDSENYKHEYSLWKENLNTGHIDDDNQKDDYTGTRTNYSLILGYQFSKFKLGINAGQSNFIRTNEYHELIKDYNGSTWFLDQWEQKEKKEVKGNWYGAGVNYGFKKFKFDLAYRQFTYDLTNKYEYIIDNGTHLEDDLDGYPIETSPTNGNQINFRGTYQLLKNWVVGLGIEMFSMDSELNYETDTWGKYNSFELTRDYLNYNLGIGQTTENIRFGCEFGYLILSEEYNSYEPYMTEIYFAGSQETELLVYQIRIGLEYDIGEKLTFRTGGVRYQSGDYNLQQTLYFPTGELAAISDKTEKIDFDDSYVLGFGLDYQIREKISIKYSYQTGEFLFDDLMESLGTQNYYKYKIDYTYTNRGIQQLRTHKFSVKYDF